jgi:hypothetical protein
MEVGFNAHWAAVKDGVYVGWVEEVDLSASNSRCCNALSAAACIKCRVLARKAAAALEWGVRFATMAR